MAAKSKEEKLAEQIGQRLLSDWDTLWQPLPDAATQSHPKLSGKVGLMRFVLGEKTMYIARAIEPKGGIAKGLRRIFGPKQTGNSSYGAQMIRKHVDQLQVEILIVSGEDNPPAVAKMLKRKMNSLYDPEWGWPLKRRMKQIQAGTLPAK